jgi:protein CpxP
MSKRKLLISIAVVAILVLAAVPFVYAQGFRRHHMDGGGLMFLPGLGRAQAALNLSDAQVDELKTIAKSVREQNAPYREQLRGGFQQIAQTLLANPNDTAAAQALIDQQATAERAMKMNMLAGFSKALNVLTPDQRAKAAQFIADRAAGGHER